MLQGGTQAARCLAVLLLGMTAGFGLTGAYAADCGPGAPEAKGKAAGEVRGQQVGDLALACYPAKLLALEGAWTFLLSGRDVLRIDDARLEVGGTRLKSERLTYSSPTSLLIDFVYSGLRPGGTAELVLLGGRQEIGRVPIAIGAAAAVPAERRQENLVRVMMKRGVILYPLHGFGGDGIVQRSVDDLGGDESFKTLLRQLEITGIKKILAEYAEDDSISWDERYLRDKVTPGVQLRQYLLYFDPTRSEAAYREILLAFDAVEDAYLNQDYRKTEKH